MCAGNDGGIGFGNFDGGCSLVLRIHDLRHTFATRVLEKSGAGRDAIARNAVALMTYMGHSNLRYTYWYLHRTPELLAEISAAAEELLTEGGS